MNNHDISSKGESISLSVSYDQDLMQFNYQDFTDGADGNAVHQIEGCHETVAFLIGDSSKPYYKKSDLIKMKKADLFQLWYEHDFGGNDELTKAEYIDDLLSITIAKYYDNLNRDFNWRSFGENITHNYFISRGYSQGDAVYIIDVGAEYDVCANEESISHILWGCPVSVFLEIGGKEYYDLVDDDYKYDKNKIIEAVNKLDISDYAKTWIAENMPDEPKYS